MSGNSSENAAAATTKDPKVRWRRRRRILLSACAAALLAGGYYGFWRYQIKRFQVVRPGVFYRVAQPSEFGFWYLVKRQGVRTVVNTRRHRSRLASGVLDPFDPSGQFEADYVPKLGARYLQWPLGDEPCWPWPTPWVIESFFQLLDDPDNWPVIVHCMGGRHRTGTLSALFRLEYDRWPVERALEEMYAFDFGHPILLHEHNLRTYVPRPRPSARQLAALREEFGPLIQAHGKAMPSDYDRILRVMSELREKPDIRRGVKDYLRRQGPFAICFAQRLIDTPSDSLVPTAVEAAAACLDRPRADSKDWAMAAALIADFGTPSHQRALARRLESQDHESQPSPRYRAMVNGVTNRYTWNRVAYLRPLLDDTRARPEPEANGARFCDTAVARMSVIVGRDFLEEPGPDGKIGWDTGLEHARRWFAENAALAQSQHLVPPEGKNPLKVGRAPTTEDQSKRR